MRRVSVPLTCTAVLLAFTGCGGSPSRTVGGSRAMAWTYSAAGLTARIPAGWHVMSRPLTGVVSPLQRLVVTSFPVRQRGLDGGCRPATALREMPPDGALLFMWEYQGPTHRDVRGEPPRPRRFRLDPRTLLPYECMGRSYMVRFRDHGRVFQAHMFLGRRATTETRRRLVSVLDSLRVRRASPRAAAVWVAPKFLFRRWPYLGVACRRPNSFACDRVGLAVWLRAPAVAVTATVDGRSFKLDDPNWSGVRRIGHRRMFAGFLQPAGLLSGRLAVHPDDGSTFWSGSPEIKAGIGLTIERSSRNYVRTSLVVRLAPGWG